MRRALATLLMVVVAIILWRFPFAKPLLWIGFGVYAVFLYRLPHAWLMAVPALLPVLDLAPWSGWFFLDEFDLVILLTLAAGLWMHHSRHPVSGDLPRGLLFSVIGVALSYAISLCIGLLPLPPLDSNAFSNYYSAYNSLRMSKGFFAALGLFVLARCTHSDKVTDNLVTGMVLGLAAITLAVIWERYRFPGIFNFTSDFRATATFSGLHNGGNDLEGYIVLAQPFVIAWLLLRRSAFAWATAFLLFVLSTYALAVTVSRAGLLAVLISWSLLAIGVSIGLRREFRLHIGKLAILGASAAIAAIVGLLLFVRAENFFQARLRAAQSDWDYRVLQSKKTIHMMDQNWSTSWFGMGLGRFPTVAYTHDPLNVRPSAYRFENELDNTFLRLSSGSPLYFGQWLSIEPSKTYRLKLRMRATGQGALTAYLCEKTLQYSFDCVSRRFEVNAVQNWQERHSDINVGAIGNSAGLMGRLSVRPVEFALSNSSRDALIDVDDVQLLDFSGKNLIVNGNFLHGMDRWFFTVDNHLPWQNWNHWVQLYFDQGWFGLICFGVFLLVVSVRLLWSVNRGDWPAAIGLASISGFMVIGVFGFLFDTPRMAMIFYFLAFCFSSRLVAVSSISSESHN